MRTGVPGCSDGCVQFLIVCVKVGVQNAVGRIPLVRMIVFCILCADLSIL